MAVLVVGGHSREVGKTSVVAGLVRAFPEYRWMAVKITQFGHGVCSANGAPCACEPGADEHEWAVTEERDSGGDSDTSRYLAAGAERSLWVRTRQQMLALAMPRLRERMVAAQASGIEHIIFESNSVMRLLRPDLYLSVLDFATADFKPSARAYLDRADAVLLHREGEALAPRWSGISLRTFAGKPTFSIAHGDYTPAPLLEFVRPLLHAKRAQSGCAATLAGP